MNGIKSIDSNTYKNWSVVFANAVIPTMKLNIAGMTTLKTNNNHFMALSELIADGNLIDVT